ncbi:gem-associated protein 4 [Myripristis murdjan]|uniref:Gem (nuclear organelle) associated protein 4 n=1 Tax=Myripristis murdjan TaxID=586833 RepID=A0A667ZT24_9TELE|nr:gem-associated protein 4 [Myripristis murdjan]
MSKDLAVLQGGFLLANKLSLPTSLSSLQKGDWPRVSHPILEAVGELCRQEGLKDCPNTSAIHWKKKLVCVLWCKLLCRETGEDVETGWKENPFFQTQSSLPEVSHVVLLELVKSMAAAGIFGRFLLCLPRAQICTELARLVQHVSCDPSSEDDVQLFLEVWRELWKGRAEQKAGGEDDLEKMFADQFARLSSQPASLSPQAAKRLKLDTSDLPPSSPDVLHTLFHALKDIRDHISTTDLCLQALSTALDTLYTSFLIDKAVILPPEEKMLFLSKTVRLRQRNDDDWSPELLREIQRDLRASHSPSQFQPSQLELTQALKIITEVAQFWQNSGLLKRDSALPSYSAYKVDQSVQRVLRALEEGDAPEVISEMDDPQTLNDVKTTLREVLESLSFPAVENSPEVNARLTMAIVNHRLEDYQDFAVLFASKKSWAVSDELWIDCLERNKAAFQQHGTVIKLASTLVSKFHSDTANLSQCRKLMKVIVDIFSALSLEDKNKALAAMLRSSSEGFFGRSVPSAVTGTFGQELNMAFNCIIQGGGGASAAVSQGNLSTAVSLVARVAFQNPKATLMSCCHSAVFNKGAFSLMAKILQQLPGLRGRERNDEAPISGEEKQQEDEKMDGRRDAGGGWSLLCSCLQETIRTKVLSASEKEQLLKFLGLLMMPVMEVEGEERRQSFLSPQEVVGAFVLPNLSVEDHGPVDIDLSLQLLHSALCLDLQEPASSPHWVLGCSPFPLLYVLAQLLNQALRCWEQPPEGALHHLSMDTKDLLVSVLTTLGQVVGAEVVSDPSSWSRAVFWLYNKTEVLDWTVRFHLKPVWGEHFKNEVPLSLLAVCDLPEQEWSGLELPQYGQGTGLLAWMECCTLSDSLQSTMLSCLSLDRRQSEHLSMFSKGLLVAVTQTLPWCSVSQWTRQLRALRELLVSGQLHVPYSLEYMDYLPLLDLKAFSCELRLSVLLLRVFQLLCGASCSDWLPEDGWAHVGRLYAHAVREMLDSLRAKLPLPSSGISTASPKGSAISPKMPVYRDSDPAFTSPRPSKVSKDSLKEPQKVEETSPLKSAPGPQCVNSHSRPPKGSTTAVTSGELQKDVGPVPCQEVLFVLSQLFCHVQHVQVMMPGGQCEALFLSSLEILSYYQTVTAAFPHSSTQLEIDNTRHFFSTITDNLDNQEMKAVLQQKIAQLTLSAA